MRRLLPVIASLALIAPLAACQSGVGANQYESRSVGEVSRVEEGTVVSSRNVMIEGQKSWIGPVVGAVAGAALGSEIGQGDKAEITGAVIGGAAGGVAGSAAEKSLTKRPGFAYTVRLRDTGKLINVVQGDDIAIPNGTPVLVEYGSRPRVTPLSSATRY